MRSLQLSCLVLLVLASGLGAQTFVGPVDNTFGNGGNYTFFADGLRFDVFSPMTITAVNCYPNGPGDVVVNLLDSAGTILQTSTTTVTTGGLTTLFLNFSILPGTGYQLNAVGTTTGGLFRNFSGAVYPYSIPGVIDITGPINNLSGYYYFFYNWLVGGSLPPPFWQENAPEASLDFDGIQVGNPYAATPATTTPFVGTPFTVNVNSNLIGTPFEIVVGTQPPLQGGMGGAYTPNGQVVNMDFSDPTLFFLYGAGPTANFIPFAANISTQIWVPGLVNATAQAVFLNALNPDGYSLTQASRMEATNSVSTIIQGDDVLMNVPLLFPIQFYGQMWSSIDVSTNGFVKFGNNATSSDLSENADDFVNGLMGGGTAAPGIAMLWEDVDMGNRPTSMVVVTESATLLTIDFIDADYFSSSALGNFSCTIDTSGMGQVPVKVTLDYTGYIGTPPTEGLVGVTDGGTSMPPSALNAWDFVTNGAVNVFNPPNVSETVFQNFDGTGTIVTPVPAEPLDLGGLIINLDDISGLGTWLVY